MDGGIVRVGPNLPHGFDRHEADDVVLGLRAHDVVGLSHGREIPSPNGKTWDLSLLVASGQIERFGRQLPVTAWPVESEDDGVTR